MKNIVCICLIALCFFLSFVHRSQTSSGEQHDDEHDDDLDEGQ